MKRIGTVVVLLCGMAAAAAPAQEDPHAACSAVGWVPREILERPVTLRPGIGRTHEPVATASAEAQAFHDQGLSYLHSYVWIEAARSFHQALRADPRAALSWVGLSRAYSGLEDQAAARAAWNKADELAAGASEKERRKIAARGLHLDAIEDLQDAGKHAAWRRALDEALAGDMDDVELWLLRGTAEERNAAGRGQRGGAASVAFYRQALAVWPDHFAAHHYLVHSYETIGRIAEALAHGERYATLADQVPHARHMWAHDLRRVGRVEEATAEFERAHALETAYYEAERLPEEVDWHRPHNLDLLATCHQHQGRLRKTEAVMRDRARLKPVLAGTEFNGKAWPGFLLSTGRYDEALAASRAMTRGRWVSTRAVGHALAGHALLALGRVAEAEKALASAEALLAEVPPGGSTVSYVSRSSVEPYVLGLEGEVLLRRGERAPARAILKDVQERIRAVPGPDAWTEALFRLEDIARAAREAGDWELAAFTAEQMRDHDAAYGGTHYALGRVAEQAGRPAEARAAYAEAVRLWAGADAELAALRDARARREALARAAAPAAAAAGR
ncbi:MAG TPA: tetratricopeptide repeat protein [Vicinamibacteria bacterium]